MRTTRAVTTLWLLFAVVSVEIVVTYSRVPAHELYHVSGGGFIGGGLSRALVFTNFPVALVAIGVLLVVGDQLSPARSLLALLALVLCAAVFWPGVVSEANLDAKAVNAVAALGVALTVALTTTPSNRLLRGFRRPENVRGNAARLVVAAVLLIVALPWIAADLGVFLGGVPVLGQAFQTGELRHQPGTPGLHTAVHHGHHHGMDGTLLVLTALVLSIFLGAVRSRRLHALAGLYLALMIAYGLGNVANDFWLEQVVKRGWTSRALPNVLQPGLTFGWLAIVLGTAALWLTLFRPRYPRRTEPTSTSSASSSSV